MVKYQEYFDINSEVDKIKVNKKNNRESNLYTPEESNQTYTDLRSSEGVGINEEYSRNKINQIKKDLLSMKDQIKKELKQEVSDELRYEFHKKMLNSNKRKKPNMINLDEDYYNNNNNKKLINNYYVKEKRSTYDGNGEIKDGIYYNKNKINCGKSKGKNRWSSVQKHYYVNSNNINNSNENLTGNNNNNNEMNQFNRNKGRQPINLKTNNNIKTNDNMSLKEKYKEKYEKLSYMPSNNNLYSNFIENTKENNSNIRRGSYKKEYLNMNNKVINDNESESYYNGNKIKNKNEIKKLIRLYNLAKDDKRKRSGIASNNSSNTYDYINNNRSVINYNFNQNNNIYNNAKMNEKKINDEINNNNNNNKININNYYNIAGNYYGDNFEKMNIPINIENDFRNNYKGEKVNSLENDSPKEQRFQMKYQKVNPKGQIYQTKAPKQRNISVNKKIDNNDYDNPFINNMNKTEDIVNFDNSNFNNEKEESNNYKNEENNSNRNNISSNDKLSITGKFMEFNNSEYNNSKKEDIRKNIISNNINKCSKTVYTKSPKAEDKKIITCEKTTEREKKSTGQNNIHCDSIYKRGNNNYNFSINNTNEIKSPNHSKRNEIQSNNSSLERKTYDKIKFNKNNYIEVKNDVFNSPYQFRNEEYNKYNINSGNNTDKSPRYNNLTTKTYYKKKKFTQYQ